MLMKNEANKNLNSPSKVNPVDAQAINNYVIQATHNRSDEANIVQAYANGCQSTVSGATNASIMGGSEANNLNKFLDIQINKNKKLPSTN